MPGQSHFANYTAHLSQIRAVYSYDHWLTRSIVHTCKYEGVRELAAVMASTLANELLCFSSCDRETILIPVPLHESKFRERGFNQSELIAMHLGDFLGRYVDTKALLRVQNTRTQVTLSRKQRRENVRGAFVCTDTQLVAGKKIILIDDISTTGSTLSEIAGVLRSGGAADVSGLVFAHGTLPSEEDLVLRADHPMVSLFGL